MALPLNIFVVDESMQLCQDLRGWLEQGGHKVNCCQVSNVFLPTLEDLSPDLIVIAVARYSGEGMQMFRRLSNHRRLKYVPLIVVSEDADLEYEMLDIFDFQARPFDRIRLQKCLQKLCSGRGKPSSLMSVSQEMLTVFKTYLLEHSALYFNQNNQRILERALLRRVQALRLDSLRAYYNYLLSQAENYDELNKLIGLLTVGETSFFRYRSHREALLHYVLPRLIDKNKDRKSVRIWSAGCSTGEEPYSLAILIRENFPELIDWDIQILATDINKRALRQAREGIYGERSLRMMEERLRKKYFRKEEAHYQISGEIREMVRFNYLNLKSDSFPVAIDMLFCRNVLIYFEMETIRNIVASFSNSLNAGGYLFMGHSETMQNVSDRFQRHNQKNAFFYQLKIPEAVQGPVKKAIKKHVSSGRPSSEDRPVKGTACKSPSRSLEGQNKRLDPEQLYRNAVNAFEHERLNEAGQLFDQLLELQPQNPLALVGKGLLLANQGQYRDARILCARAIKENDLLPEAYLLRGLILDMEGFLERALVEYQKVLWLDANFVMAHYLSASIYGRLASNEEKQRSLRNAARSLEKLKDSLDSVPFSGGLSCGVFLEIVHRELAAPCS
jgi:chemotaxis protein methyltransferase CheR